MEKEKKPEFFGKLPENSPLPREEEGEEELLLHFSEEETSAPSLPESAEEENEALPPVWEEEPEDIPLLFREETPEPASSPLEERLPPFSPAVSLPEEEPARAEEKEREEAASAREDPMEEDPAAPAEVSDIPEIPEIPASTERPAKPTQPTPPAPPKPPKLPKLPKLPKKSRSGEPGKPIAPVETPAAASSHPSEEKQGAGAFYASLAALRAADIAPKAKKTPGELLHLLLRPTALLLFGVMFFYAAYTVVYNLITYSIADERYQQLAGNFSLESSAGTGPLLYTEDLVTLPDFAGMLSGDFVYKEVVTPEDGGKTAVYRARLAALKEKNPDTFGWISIDGTNISYPLVQGSDNDFYLDHDFSGAYYTVGSIFVDYRCLREMRMNPNLVIYGHNIRTRGIMFNQLLRYTDRSFFDSHPEIVLYTPEGRYVYEIFSFFQTTADGGYANVYFYGDEDFVNYCKRMRASSWYQREGVTDESFAPDTRLLTLSTCTNGDAAERYAVVARLKESQTD